MSCLLRTTIAAFAIRLAACPHAFAQDSDTLYCDGKRMFTQGTYHEAIRLLDRAVESGLREARVYRCRAFVRLLCGRPEMAIADFTHAMNLHDHDAGLYYGRGVGHYFLGSLTQASQDLEEALRLLPDYVEASALRQAVLLELGDAAGWLQESTRRSTIADRCRKTGHETGMAFGAGCEMYCFEDTGAVSLRSLLPYKCWNLVFREIRNNATTASRPDGSVRAQVDEKDLYAHSIRSAADGDLNGSLSGLSAALARAPSNSRLHQMRGAVWALKGNLSAAAGDISEAIRLNRSDISLYQLRSSIYRAMKEWERSAADTNMVIELAGKKLESAEKKLQQWGRKENWNGNGTGERKRGL